MWKKELQFRALIRYLHSLLHHLTISQPIHQFFKKVAQIRDLNQSVFNTLHAYYPPPQETPLIFHPPQDDHSDQFLSGQQTGAIPMTMRGSRPVTAVPAPNSRL